MGQQLWLTISPDLLLASPSSSIMLRAKVDPPPQACHPTVRAGKRYGKTSLAARRGREPLAGKSPSCREPLGELDPDGAFASSRRVGRIMFKDCKTANQWADPQQAL